jgi:hypothetical protein
MFLMIEAALPAFGAEGGSIIDIGSEASVTAYPTLSIYVASKSAVNGLTRVLSKEFGPRKIRVNALNPGGTETEGAHAAGVMGTESKKQIIASTPLGRVGQPEDIARVAVFLASDDAGWLTGGQTDQYSGGAVWQPPAIDPKRGALFIGTGNNYTVPATVIACQNATATANCTAPDDFFDTALAMDLKTGQIKWAKTLQGFDTWTVACLTSSGPKPNCPVPSSPDFEINGTGNNKVFAFTLARKHSDDRGERE